MSKALELAKKVLNDSNILMDALSIYEYAKKMYPNIVKETFNGNTPEHTLGACLYVNSKKINSEFCRVKMGTDAVKFGLKSKNYENIEIQDIRNVPCSIDVDLKEKFLHKFLCSYMREIQDCYCKTINANKSKNKTKNKNKWKHPDIIGVKFLKENYNKKTIDLMKCNNDCLFELYSFELKQSVDMSDINDKFFQAASNSSWANYGYLVVKDLDEDDEDLNEKLQRLNGTFGIGVIKLNIKTYNDSKIIIQAKKKENIDYDIINDMIELENDDIIEFFTETINICNDTREEVVDKHFDLVFQSATEGEEYAKKNGVNV